MQLITITNVLGGFGPYEIYACDPTLVYCEQISPSVSLFPYSFLLTTPLEGSQTIIVKIIDTSTGCEKFIPYTCPEVSCFILTETSFPIITEDNYNLITEDCPL